MTVEGAAPAAVVRRAVEEFGMTARLEEESPERRGFWKTRGRLLMTVLSGVCLAFGLASLWSEAGEFVTRSLLALSAVTGGWFVAPRGWRAVRHGALDMNFLMLSAAVGGVLIGEWAESASVLFLFSVAQLLESYSMDGARHAIRALMELSPAEATVRRDGREQKVPAGEVQVGEVLIVRPGQKVPLDGEVLAGRSSVNQAAITGESMPVDKASGDHVFAGSINEHGMLEVRSEKRAHDTTLARVIHAVEEAQSTRAPSQSFVDRFSRIYTPAVVAGAVLVFVGPPALGFGDWETWFYRALALLVIACPCALVISTPVSIVSALAGASRRGVLIKGGVHLENAGAATVVAFDKTGTLTHGRPVVTDVLAQSGMERTEVLRLAGALEQGSEHSLAEAVLAAARAEKIALPPATEFQAMAGRGVQAVIGGRTYFLGGERLARERGALNRQTADVLRNLEEQGKTTLLLADESGPLGVLAAADQVRAEAADAVAALHAKGIRTVMLTGDNPRAARAVAVQVGVDDHWASLLPEDKVRVVRELEEKGERVIFVGDGVNDAPALAAATVGVAMGAAGTDVALETADVALMADDLSKLPLALAMSRKTLRIIKENIAFSIAVKAVFVVLAVAGWATLWMAVAADMGSSLAVIANGLRARTI